MNISIEQLVMILAKPIPKIFGANMISSQSFLKRKNKLFKVNIFNETLSSLEVNIYVEIFKTSRNQF